MAVWEKAASRQIIDEESPSAETTWFVSGATSYADAYADLIAAPLPTTFTFPSSRVASINGVEATELRDDEFWVFKVSYAAQPKPTFDDTEFEFEVSAPSERVYQSLATTGYAPATKSAPPFGGAIGVSDGEPRGADLLSPVSTFSITKHWAVASVTQAYQLVIESLVGSVCNATFNGRAIGTVKLLGVRGRRSGDKFPITYQFGYRPNVSSYVVDAITVTSAKGWEIIDTYYETQTDATTKKLVRRPRAVYVHRVHPESSWAGLNL